MPRAPAMTVAGTWTLRYLSYNETLGGRCLSSTTLIQPCEEPYISICENPSRFHAAWDSAYVEITRTHPMDRWLSVGLRQNPFAIIVHVVPNSNNNNLAPLYGYEIIAGNNVRQLCRFAASSIALIRLQQLINNYVPERD